MPCPAQNLHTEVPGLAAAAQHHSPGRSQLILNPQLGELSSQPVWQAWEEDLPQASGFTGSHWPVLLPTASTSWHTRHCFLRCLSSSQGLEGTCQGNAGPPSGLASHLPVAWAALWLVGCGSCWAGFNYLQGICWHRKCPQLHQSSHMPSQLARL